MPNQLGRSSVAHKPVKRAKKMVKKEHNTDRKAEGRGGSQGNYGTLTKKRPAAITHHSAFVTILIVQRQLKNLTVLHGVYE